MDIYQILYHTKKGIEARAFTSFEKLTALYAVLAEQPGVTILSIERRPDNPFLTDKRVYDPLERRWSDA